MRLSILALVFVFLFAGESNSETSASSDSVLFLGTSECVLVDEPSILPPGTVVFAHFTDGSVAKGKITGQKVIGHPSDERDEFPCATISFDSDSHPKDSRYFIISTIAPNANRVKLEHNELSDTVETVLREQATRIGNSEMERKFYWPCERLMSRDAAFRKAFQSAKFSPDFATRVVHGNHSVVAIASLKLTDTTPFDNEPWCRHPLFLHEIVGVELKINGETSSAPFHLGSVTGAGGDGTNYLREYSAEEFLNETILGAFDADSDGMIELLISGSGAESSWFNLFEIQDGQLIDLGVNYHGGL